MFLQEKKPRTKTKTKIKKPKNISVSNLNTDELDEVQKKQFSWIWFQENNKICSTYPFKTCIT